MSEVVTTPRAKVGAKTPACAGTGSGRSAGHRLTFSTAPDE
jgi:hypothetical protein